MSINVSLNANVEAQAQPSESNSVKKKSSLLSNAYIAEAITSTKRDRSKQDELAEYEAEMTENPDCEPSEIFTYGCMGASKSNRWPRLKAMAKDLLCIPVTSAASARAFSVGKDVFGIARQRLGPETVEALVC